MKTIPIENVQVGDLVFLDRKDNPYHRGERIVVIKTPYSILCIKPSVNAYDLHDVQSFEIAGEKPYDICGVSFEKQLITDLVREGEQHISDIRAGLIKKNWCDNVYTTAELNIRRLRNAYKERTGKEIAAFVPKEPVVLSEFRSGKFYIDNGLVSRLPDNASVNINIAGNLFMAPKRIKGWINLYGKKSYNPDEALANGGLRHGNVYPSKPIADDSAVGERIACVEVEFTEGEGL